ncbi:MAG TPA: JAB domain-containing protein [Candidatus Saccharibacteria bacterium]|nr:JAB domain-containing protein [Candidatus Saccharibacteria bacterium]
MLVRLKFIRSERQEYTLCLSLDSASRLIVRRTVTIGTLTASLIHPREVFAEKMKAARDNQNKVVFNFFTIT